MTGYFRGSVLDVEPNFGAFAGLYRNPGFTDVGINLNYHAGRGLTLYGNLRNALNRYYEEAFGFPALEAEFCGRDEMDTGEGAIMDERRGKNFRRSPAGHQPRLHPDGRRGRDRSGGRAAGGEGFAAHRSLRHRGRVEFVPGRCARRPRRSLASTSSAAILLRVQHELFNLGSILATRPEDVHPRQARVTEQEIARLETEMDKMNEGLPELRSFVLPGGCRLNAELHVCRTVCRRAERRLVSLARAEQAPVEAVKYLNRLSDALFVWSRWSSVQAGAPETLWEPNRSASGIGPETKQD